MKTLKFQKTRDVKNPERGTPGSAGIDFFIPKKEKEIVLHPLGSTNIPSGIKCDVPEGYALIAMNKSGIALNKGLQVGACVVDSDYEGEIHLHLTNIGKSIQVLRPGDKLVQFLLIPVLHLNVEMVDTITYTGNTSLRGSKGFGKGTGTK